MEYLSSETAWEMINERNEEIKQLAAERDDLRRHHDACIKELYRILGVDGSDGEYRFKWVALEALSLVKERDKLKDALEEIKNLGIGDHMIYAHKIVDEALKESA